MSKKSKSKRSNAITSHIASPAVRPIKIQSSMAPLKALSERLRIIEDRRTWSPAGPQRSARSFNKPHHQLVMKKAAAKPRRGSSLLSSKIAFHAPKKVLICVRRETRKEVLFAKNRAGKNFGKRHRNFYSSVSCR